MSNNTNSTKKTVSVNSVALNMLVAMMRQAGKTRLEESEVTKVFDDNNVVEKDLRKETLAKAREQYTAEHLREVNNAFLTNNVNIHVPGTEVLYKVKPYFVKFDRSATSEKAMGNLAKKSKALYTKTVKEFNEVEGLYLYLAIPEARIKFAVAVATDGSLSAKAFSMGRTSTKSKYLEAQGKAEMNNWLFKRHSALLTEVNKMLKGQTLEGIRKLCVASAEGTVTKDCRAISDEEARFLGISDLASLHEAQKKARDAENSYDSLMKKAEVCDERAEKNKKSATAFREKARLAKDAPKSTAKTSKTSKKSA